MVRGEVILIHQILLRQLISPQIAKATKQRAKRDVELTVREATTVVRIQSIDSSTDSEKQEWILLDTNTPPSPLAERHKCLVEAPRFVHV